MLDDDLVFAQSSASSIPARAASTASLSHAASDASERVLGYALYDPKMSFTTDTGAQLKNLSYYKRAWTTGKPYSTSAILTLTRAPTHLNKTKSGVIKPRT